MRRGGIRKALRVGKINKLMNMKTTVGGWTPFSSEINAKEQEVFKEALDGLMGVNYTPVAVSTQVVNGTNYSFFCNAQPVYPGAKTEGAMVEIYAPIEGEPHITEIKMVMN